IENIFFQYTHCLVNIQIMSWNQYLKQLQLQYHLTQHHLLSQVEWVYHLRNIFNEETFHCFDMENPLPFINELIPLIKDYELYQISYQDIHHTKLQDFWHIYQSLLSRLDSYTHLTLESLFQNITFHEQDHLIIEA